MQSIQINPFTSSAALDLFRVQTFVIFACTTVTNIALRMLFINYPRVVKMSSAIALITSTALLSTTMSHLSVAALVVNLFVAYIGVHRHFEGKISSTLLQFLCCSFQTRLLTSLYSKNVKTFIQEAIRKERPILVRLLILFLFQSKEFPIGTNRLFLLLYLQKVIASSILRFNKPDLVQSFFADKQMEIEGEIDRGREVTDVTRPMLDLDANGNFKAYVIMDESLRDQLQGHPNQDIQKLATLPGNDHLQNALNLAALGQPSFENIDLQPLIDRLVFTNGDSVREFIPSQERYGS